MVNRVLLRIKIIQILFSYYKGLNSDIETAKNELSVSLGKTYELYFLLIRLGVEIMDFAVERRDAINRRNTIAGSLDLGLKEKKPAEFLCSNAILQQWASNKMLKEFLDVHKLTWNGSYEVVAMLYNAVLKSQAYADAENEEAGYDNDRKFLRKIYRDVIAKSDMLGEELERMSIYWNDDEEIVISFILKTINLFSQEDNEDKQLLPMYRDDSDETFGLTLLTKTIYNETEYRELIDRNTKNWDMGRIAFMDIVIMQTAIAELIAFPQIPVNVTLSEYVEIAKYYSTQRSGVFVNGVLDAVVKDLKANGKLVKAAITPLKKLQ